MSLADSFRSKSASLGKQVRRSLAPFLPIVLHPLSKLAPRSPRHWAFGHSGDKFMGNPRYLFLWMVLHRPDIRVTWISGSKEVRRRLRVAGLPVRGRWSLPGIWATLRAKVFVFGHGVGNVNASLSGNAFLLNLWHGVGLKAVHLGFAGGKTAKAERLASNRPFGALIALEYLKPYDALVTTSDMMQSHFAQQTRLPLSHCPQLGYPRLDCAGDPILAELVEVLDRSEGFAWNPDAFREVYIYVPTYRDTGRCFLNEAVPEPTRLSEILRARGALLYMKPHPQTQAIMAGSFDNIRTWPEHIDVNAYLDRFTGLITDYSSILYDYLAVKRTGAILYTFDYDDYVANDRTLMFPFDDNVAGVRVSSFAELCEVLEDGRALGSEGADQVERVRDRFWGGSLLPASPAIVDYVEERLTAELAA